MDPNVQDTVRGALILPSLFILLILILIVIHFIEKFNKKN